MSPFTRSRPHLHFTGTHERSRRQNNRFRPRRTLKGDFSMRIRKLLLVGGATAAVALASVAAAVAGAQAIRGTVQADGSSTVAPFARASSTCEATRSLWSTEISEPTCGSKSYAAPSRRFPAASTNLRLNSS